MKDLINSRRSLEAKKKLDDLAESIKSTEEFIQEIKAELIGLGKSNMIHKEKIEELLEKHSLK